MWTVEVHPGSTHSVGDIAYHVTVLPVLIVTFALAVPRPAR